MSDKRPSINKTKRPSVPKRNVSRGGRGSTVVGNEFEYPPHTFSDYATDSFRFLASGTDCPYDNATGGDSGLFTVASTKPNNLSVSNSQAKAFIEHEFDIARTHKETMDGESFCFASSDDFDDKIKVATPHTLARFNDEWLGVTQLFLRNSARGTVCLTQDELALARKRLKRVIRNQKILRALMILFIGVLYTMLIIGHT